MQQPNTVRRRLILGAAATGFGFASGVTRGQPANVIAAQAERKVVVYSTTDAQYSQSMFDAFSRRYNIEVEVRSLATSNLYSQVISEAAANQVGADVVWSAAMDLQMALYAAGHALVYESATTQAIPQWARFKNALFATSLEPVGLAYNTRALQAAEMPKTYADLIRFISESPKVKGRTATVDAEKSGLAYMLHANDARRQSDYWLLAGALGKAKVKAYMSAANVLESVTSGENALCTHVNGSYALELQKTNPNVRAHFIKDFTAGLMRVSFVNGRAPRPNAAKLLMDFMLSAEGQERLAGSGLPSVLGDGNASPLSKLRSLTGAEVSPIALDESLLKNVDRANRLAFIREWKKAVGR